MALLTIPKLLIQSTVYHRGPLITATPYIYPLMTGSTGPEAIKNESRSSGDENRSEIDMIAIFCILAICAAGISFFMSAWCCVSACQKWRRQNQQAQSEVRRDLNLGQGKITPLKKYVQRYLVIVGREQHRAEESNSQKV